MKYALYVMFLVAAALAGDTTTQSGITELCGTYPDGSQWFTLELVKILAEGKARSGQYVFHHRNGKMTLIFYDSKTQIFRVKKNYASQALVPASEEAVSLGSVIIDPVSGQTELVQWK